MLWDYFPILWTRKLKWIKVQIQENSARAGFQTKVSLTPSSFPPHCGISGWAETRTTGPGCLSCGGWEQSPSSGHSAVTDHADHKGLWVRKSGPRLTNRNTTWATNASHICNSQISQGHIKKERETGKINFINMFYLIQYIFKYSFSV